MSNRMKLEGNWQEARGRIKEAWGNLTDDDLDRVEGRWDRLVGVIKQKTGQGLAQIEATLGMIVDSLDDQVGRETQESKSAEHSEAASKRGDVTMS